jgi:hypothetical protein
MFLINLYAIFIDSTLGNFPFKLFYTTYCTIGVACAVFAKIRESLHVRTSLSAWLLSRRSAAFS